MHDFVFSFSFALVEVKFISKDDHPVLLVVVGLRFEVAGALELLAIYGLARIAKSFDHLRRLLFGT